MKTKKRYMWVVPAVALLVAVLFAASHRFAAASGVDENGGDRTLTPLAVTLANATRGVVFKTAAINANGTVATCFRCIKASTTHIATGEYQVAFDENITATLGWSRWVQVDYLTSGGSIANISCTTADRTGLVSGVYVQCSNNSTGVQTDTSFFLFIAR
jgi:hypothetical protein